MQIGFFYTELFILRCYNEKELIYKKILKEGINNEKISSNSNNGITTNRMCGEI